MSNNVTFHDPNHGLSVPLPCVQDIKHDAKVRHGMAERACQASGISIGHNRLTVCGYFVKGGVDNPILHVPIGDWEAEAAFVERWSAEPGCNVYRGFSIVPASLSMKRRGKRDDVLGVFGLCADLDADKSHHLPRIEDLPAHPSMAVVTSVSMAGTRNFQVTYFFDRVVCVDDADRIAAKLCLVSKDRDGGTRDPVHVWRPPGSLNYPKSSKLKRGRSEVPQLVHLDAHGTGATLTPRQLEAALDVALETETKPGLALPKQWASTGEQCPSGIHDDAVTGDLKLEVTRYVSATRACDLIPRDNWFKTGAAWHHFSNGADWGYRIWRDASREQWEHHRTLRRDVEMFDEELQRRTWLSYQQRAGKLIRMGTVVRIAQDAGWDASRRRFGLNAGPTGWSIDPGVRAVLAAAARMPKEGLFHQAREALTLWFVLHTKSLRQARMLLIISAHINYMRGYAWPGYRQLADNLSLREGEKCSLENARKIVCEIVEAGVLIASDGRVRNGTGRVGPSFALLPPAELVDWGGLLDWARVRLGHDVRTTLTQHGKN